MAETFSVSLPPGSPGTGLYFFYSYSNFHPFHSTPVNYKVSSDYGKQFSSSTKKKKK